MKEQNINDKKIEPYSEYVEIKETYNEKGEMIELHYNDIPQIIVDPQKINKPEEIANKTKP